MCGCVRGFVCVLAFVRALARVCECVGASVCRSVCGRVYVCVRVLTRLCLCAGACVGALV